MKLTLSDSLSQRVAALANERGFTDAEHYIEVLLDEDWREGSDDIEALLLEGLESEPIEVTSGFWEKQKQKFLEGHPEASK